jgi:hypothetical protein
MKKFKKKPVSLAVYNKIMEKVIEKTSGDHVAVAFHKMLEEAAKYKIVEKKNGKAKKRK